MLKLCLPSSLNSSLDDDSFQATTHPRVKIRKFDEKITFFYCGKECRVISYVKPNAIPNHGYFGSIFDNSAINQTDSNEDSAEMSSASVKAKKKKTFEDYYEDKEPKILLKLDPLDWKNQDHYAVLGLGKMRRNANAEDIKKACKFK
jgi:hypothetical protein